VSFSDDVVHDAIAEIFDLTKGSDVALLLSRFDGQRPSVLRELVRQASELGARMAVLEFRYVDPDYRSEYTRFYSSAFRRYPSVASRLNFFAETVEDGRSLVDDPTILESLTYVGYCVLRPLPAAPVGRVMLRAPDWAAADVTCSVVEEVSLFGSPLLIEGAPFIAQDGQLGVCAHAALWMTAHQHHLRDGRRRVLPGEVFDAVPESGLGRRIPATGLSVHQLSGGFSRLGLPALIYFEDRLPVGEDIDARVPRMRQGGWSVGRPL
jgi:hypothetical protein